MSAVMVSLTLVLSILTTGILVEWIARSRHPRRLFFLALGRVRSESDEARARRLRVVNAVVTGVGVLLVLAPFGELAKVLATTVCPLLSVTWMMVEMWGAFRSATLDSVPSRYAVSLSDPPTWRDYVSVPLQVLNVLLVVVPSALFAWALGRLPAEIPAHYDLAGNVDRMASPHELWLLGGMLVFDVLLLWAVIGATVKERWVMPEEGAERYVELQFTRRRLMVRMMEWVMTFVNLGMAVTWMTMVFPSPAEGEGVGVAAFVTLALSTVGVFVPLGVYLPRMTKVQDEIREIAGTEVLGTRPSGWKFGGLVYYAPEDPAVFVPKRIGIGQTLNMARPSAWIFLAVIVLLPIAIPFGFALAS